MKDEVDVKARAAERLDQTIAALRKAGDKQWYGHELEAPGLDGFFSVLGIIAAHVLKLERGVDDTGKPFYRGPVTGEPYYDHLPLCGANSIGLTPYGTPRDHKPWVLPAKSRRNALVGRHVIDLGYLVEGLYFNFEELADLLQANRERLIDIAK